MFCFIVVVGCTKCFVLLWLWGEPNVVFGFDCGGTNCFVYIYYCSDLIGGLNTTQYYLNNDCLGCLGLGYHPIHDHKNLFNFAPNYQTHNELICDRIYIYHCSDLIGSRHTTPY